MLLDCSIWTLYVYTDNIPKRVPCRRDPNVKQVPLLYMENNGSMGWPSPGSGGECHLKNA